MLIELTGARTKKPMYLHGEFIVAVFANIVIAVYGMPAESNSYLPVGYQIESHL